MDPSYRTTCGFLGLVLLSPDAFSTDPGAAVFHATGETYLVTSARSGHRSTQTHPSSHDSRDTDWLDGPQEAVAGLMKIGLGEELGTPSWSSHLFGAWRFRRYAPILRYSFYNSSPPSLLSDETSLAHPG